MLIDPSCPLFQSCDDDGSEECCRECGSMINIGECDLCIDCCEECRKDYIEWQYNDKNVVSHYFRDDPDLVSIGDLIDSAKKVQVTTVSPQESGNGKTVMVVGLRYDDCAKLARLMGLPGNWWWVHTVGQLASSIRNAHSFAFVMVDGWTVNSVLGDIKRALVHLGVVEITKPVVPPPDAGQLIREALDEFQAGPLSGTPENAQLEEALSNARTERIRKKIQDTSKMVFVIAGSHMEGHDFIRQMGTVPGYKCLVVTNDEHIRGHISTTRAYVTVGTWANHPGSASVKLACQRAGLERFE